MCYFNVINKKYMIQEKNSKREFYEKSFKKKIKLKREI